MEFAASNGRVILEDRIFRILSTTIKNLKKQGLSFVNPWEREFLGWFLNKNINDHFIHLYQNITEEELKQLEQLIDHLEL